jgi:hypothetical protein
MKQEEQTCIENSLVYINVGWLLVVDNKKVANCSAPSQHSFPLPVKIMDIIHNDESSCFLQQGWPLNNKLKTSPNILNLTLNPYALHMFTMKEARLLWHFMNFSKHMPAYIRALHVYRRSKAHPGRV